jgi:hypothetical protein
VEVWINVFLKSVLYVLGQPPAPDSVPATVLPVGNLEQNTTWSLDPSLINKSFHVMECELDSFFPVVSLITVLNESNLFLEC